MYEISAHTPMHVSVKGKDSTAWNPYTASDEAAKILPHNAQV